MRFLLRSEARPEFSSLTGVGAGAYGVHGDRQRLVRLGVTLGADVRPRPSERRHGNDVRLVSFDSLARMSSIFFFHSFILFSILR